MKWQKVFKVYTVSEDGLLKIPKDSGWSIFNNWYQSEDEAIKDIDKKSEIHYLPDELVIIPCMVKVLA